MSGGPLASTRIHDLDVLRVIASEGPLTPRALLAHVWPGSQAHDASPARACLRRLVRAELVRVHDRPHPDGFRAGGGPLYEVTEKGREALASTEAARR